VKTPGFLRRRPVRLRLALTYSGLFLLAGAALLTVTYGLAANTLPAGPSGNLSAKAARFVNSDSFPSLKTCKQNATSPQATEKCKQEAAQAAQIIAAEAAANARAQTLNDLLDYSLAALALMTVVSGVLGWIVAGRALRPVHAITAAARRASEQNLSERIALAGPADELKELADTFDAMLARLDAAFASQRRFVANASHELRTPLAVMRTAIDVTLAKPTRTAGQLEAMAAEVRQATEQAERLVEALLTLARSDRGQGPRSALDVAVFAEDALDVAAPAIKASSLRVTSELAPAPAVGDPVLVERLVANLIDNAVRHNVADGWVEVSTGDNDGMAFISVANGGPVIEETEVASLFEPFRRLCPHQGADASSGVGLGLSIVQSVVTAHRGQVTARPQAGGGLAVLVLLPASR
jgi:signal transduction histidine kinase